MLLWEHYESFYWAQYIRALRCWKATNGQYEMQQEKGVFIVVVVTLIHRPAFIRIYFLPQAEGLNSSQNSVAGVRNDYSELLKKLENYRYSCASSYTKCNAGKNPSHAQWLSSKGIFVNYTDSYGLRHACEYVKYKSIHKENKKNTAKLKSSLRS